MTENTTPLVRVIQQIAQQCQQQRWLDAQAVCDDALKSYGDEANLLYLRGYIESHTGDILRAAAYLEASLKLDASSADRHSDLGHLLQSAGHHTEALAWINQGLLIDPTNIHARLNMAVCLGKLGDYQAAIEHYLTALQTDPDNALVYRNLCFAYRQVTRLDEAIAAGEKATKLEPSAATGHDNLAGAFLQQGQVKQAIKSFRRSIEIDPSFQPAQSNLLLAMHYDPDVSQDEIRTSLVTWANQFEKPLLDKLNNELDDKTNKTEDLTLQPHQNEVPRVGFVSGDFRGHPIYQFLIPLLDCHSPARVLLFAYSNNRQNDNFTPDYQRGFDFWRDVSSLSDQDLAAKVRSDKIDVLIDLSGHTGNNRLLMFARRPAPMQISWLGYPGPTFMQSIDGFLCDKFTAPNLSTDDQHLQKLIPLDPTFCCYRPPANAPDVSPLPARSAGFITFGSLNNPTKLSECVLAIWGDLMRHLSESQLVLQGLAYSDQGACRRVLNILERHGVTPDRITIHPPEGLSEHLGQYHHIDIALDSYPWSGHTTMLNALWMGVPVISLNTGGVASSMGTSVLANLDLEEFCTTSQQQYLNKAIELGQNLDRLQSLRTSLRGRLQASALCDEKRYAFQFEQLIHKLVDQRSIS